MSGQIPRQPSWCTICRCPELYGEQGCSHHWLLGVKQDYTGLDLYEPSEWVLSVVGGRYRGAAWAPGGGAVTEFTCDGYDPRSGFWLRADSGEQRCVSERAIDRTFHRVRAA